ncbi:MAG: hypothetical protein P1Q69_01355 [Candidatus Thorarchaeota archaeon]|nr:hypothetical protein [Candidatus Thorarchaeota archaeon]
MNVNVQGSKAILLAMIITLGVSSAAFLYIINSSDTYSGRSGIDSIRIMGNSSDIVYPELMEAYISRDSFGNWLVSATFLDDSEGWENPEAYERTFNISSGNVTAIENALINGLDDTHPSEDVSFDNLESYPHVGFAIEVLYTNGTWIYVCTFQTEKGHIILKRGSGTPDTNLDGPLLESIEALEDFVAVVQNVFSSNMS